MKYEIIKKSWSKRRKIEKEKTVLNIEFANFKKEHNHFCKMIVTYETNEVETLISRVVYNEITDSWTIDGMSLAVRLLN